MSKGESSSVIIKSELGNDDVRYIDKIKVEKKILGEADTEVNLEYIKEESLIEVKQEEITIKDEIPSSSDIQTDLTNDNVVITEDIELSPKSLGTEISISTDGKRFACTFCQYKTSRKRDFKRHTLKHTGEKPFVCNVCEFKTADTGNLKKHILKHTGEKPFGCHLCEFKTAYKSLLKRHLIKHTGEKLFSCNLCEFKTAHKYILKCHMMKHTGEKPFACSLCEFKTTQKSNLKRHMMKHKGEKPFTCNICEFKTIQKIDLKNHMMEHTGEKPFAYNICDIKEDNICHYIIMADESLMEVKQGEIIIKTEIPSSSGTQNN